MQMSRIFTSVAEVLLTIERSAKVPPKEIEMAF